MNERPNDERIERAIEGLLPAEELEALKAEVIRDPKVRTAYVERMWLHATLRAERETLVELLRDGAPSEKIVRWPIAMWAAAAAACVTLVVSIAAFGRATLFHRPVATLVQADNCKWAGSDLPTAVDSKLSAGTLALVEGIATLKFKSGATVTIEAPTKLKIVDAMHCRLLEGSLVAEVPEPAHGFTIDTADMKVIDLGTKFGVTAGSAGNSQVRVFEGQVDVDSTGSARKRLQKGTGLTVNSGSLPPDQEVSRAQSVEEDGGWTAITTAFGQGKDGYARRRGAKAGTQPLIMVKHTDIPRNRNDERRGVLTFDVSGIKPGNVAEAQLVLDPEPSGYGFSALVPDSRFAVYGLTDEALDAWDEKELAWTSMPGCSDEGPNLGQARKLAEFWIPRGGSGDPLTVRSDALAEFIRTDTNGLVSFLIVRETGETDSSGLAHAFASKEHPSARPPTLRIK